MDHNLTKNRKISIIFGTDIPDTTGHHTVVQKQTLGEVGTWNGHLTTSYVRNICADNLQVTIEVKCNIHGVSKNVPLCHCPYTHQILTDFQNYFICTFCGKSVITLTWLSNIPPHRNCVATLPCDI